jgi:ATP-dependent DNA ligase
MSQRELLRSLSPGGCASRRIERDCSARTHTGMAWKARRSGTKLKPPGFIEPALSMLTKQAPSGPRWLHEIKHDGYRLICRIDETGIRCWSRHRTNFTGVFPQIDDALRTLPGATVLDGEAIIELPTGHHDFDALRTSEGRHNAIYLAFDLMLLDGEDIRAKPLLERRALLDCWRAPRAPYFAEGSRLTAKADVWTREEARKIAERIARGF